MLDQNTDRMWYAIGAVLIGAAIIFGMNTFMPETFASVGGMFEDLIGIVNYDPKREEIEGLIAEGYIPIATADELDSIRNNTPRTYGKGTEWEDEYTGGLGEKYIQVADIDLSVYSEEGWSPIGTNPSRFRGSFDGGNYVITRLEVKGNGKDYQGLFGYADGAAISNVGLIDNKVTGDKFVGGLVGEAGNRSTIINSYATGSTTGNRQVGGLVGYSTDSTTISNSYATGSVTGSGSNIGGLVGFAFQSIIKNSYATGSVTGTYWYVGGLAGEAQRTKISNSYATGSVKGSHFVGGLVGQADSGTISNSYWDTETTGQSGSAGEGEGKTTNEMKKQSTYSGWDFDTVWKIDGNDYPTLR